MSWIKIKKKGGEMGYGKRQLCDYAGMCTNEAYKKVYPSLVDGKSEVIWWMFLCKRHFKEQQKKYCKQLPYCDVF